MDSFSYLAFLTFFRTADSERTLTDSERTLTALNLSTQDEEESDTEQIEYVVYVCVMCFFYWLIDTEHIV